MIMWVVIVVVLLVLGGFMLMSRNSTQPATETPDTTTSETQEEMAMEKEETAMEDDAMVAGEIKVTGKNFAFDPKEIRVKKGEKVTIVFTSEGGIMHDFVVDELNVATKQLTAGQSETVEFTPTQAGTFEFYCSVGNHRAMGMVGNLIVE